MTKKSDVKLLVIEDSQTEIEKLKYFLETEEFQVEWVKNADEAFAYLKKETPTLILSDIIMPGISGFDLTGKLKRDKRYRHIPIVLITSLSEPQDVIRGLECGANNFITKPYTRD